MKAALVLVEVSWFQQIPKIHATFAFLAQETFYFRNQIQKVRECCSVVLSVWLDPRATLDRWEQKDPIKCGISPWMAFALTCFFTFSLSLLISSSIFCYIFSTCIAHLSFKDRNHYHSMILKVILHLDIQTKLHSFL